MWKYIAGAIAVGSVTYGLKEYFGGGVCYCTSRLDGLVIIITGANSGIGKQLAIELAKRGATLILACRNVEQANETKFEIIELVGDDTQIHVKYLDLNSFDTVRKFAEDIDKEFKEIYALVNNAGVFYHPQQLTNDKFDVTFQTNYLGPVLLTQLLLNTLKRAEHARIVNVASEAHRLASANDLSTVTDARGECSAQFIAYGVSKLALVLFTKELSNRIANKNIVVNAVDPGNVETPIYRHFPLLNGSSTWKFILQWPLRRIMVKTPYQGCQSILHALLMKNRSTGQYIQDCKFAIPSVVSTDQKLATSYYNKTLKLLTNFLTESDC